MPLTIVHGSRRSVRQVKNMGFAIGHDAVLSSKVKATFVDAKDLQANAFKVVSERGTVYLMGRVTEREAEPATELARSVAGVQRVVRVFEILTEAELANLGQKK